MSVVNKVDSVMQSRGFRGQRRSTALNHFSGFHDERIPSG